MDCPGVVRVLRVRQGFHGRKGLLESAAAGIEHVKRSNRLDGSSTPVYPHTQLTMDEKRVRQGGLTRRRFLQSLAAGGAVLVVGRSGVAGTTRYAEGTVFHDRSGSGSRQAGDPGIAGVRVSNGREVTVTDERGYWRLPLEAGRNVLFVVKPRGWRTPLSRHLLPRFYRVEDPAGSPPLRYPGIEPTGSLPDAVDFPLYPQEEPERFRVLMCGDPQPRDGREVGFLAQSAVPDLSRTEAAFGVSLGDIMFDDLDLFEPLNEAMALVGRPWYNVLGNHDLNFDVPDNEHANDTFLRVYGPSYYAFEYGPVHFLVLNNVEWLGQDPERPQATGNYRGFLGERQLAFIRNELALVPRETLTVLLMHIPLFSGHPSNPRVETGDRQQLYRILEDRPHLLSLSAHRHWHTHFFLGEEDGWRGQRPLHHLVMGTLCGSWFRGAPESDGIPHATMTDGTPRGYAVFTFEGHRYSMDGYRVMGRTEEEQMHIDLPNVVERRELGGVTVHVNVYNGSERSTVRMRLKGRDEWSELERVEKPDPRYVRLFERDRELPPPYLPPSNPSPCRHLWAGPLPHDLEPGTYLIEIEARDMFGNVHGGSRPLRVIG